MIHMVLLVLLIVGTINATPTRNIYCTPDSDEVITDDIIESIPKANIYCQNIDIQKGDILRLKTQIAIRNSVYFLSVTGHIDETALGLFPNVIRVVVFRSNLTGIALQSETKEFVLVSSSFPKITREALKGVKQIKDLLFSSNPGLEFEAGAFKDLKMLRGLGFLNQTIPRLQRSFLEGPEYLEVLFVVLTNLTEIDEDAFVDHPHLDLLVLDDNPLQSFKANISMLSKLTELSLTNTNLKEISFAFAGSLNRLRRLFLPTRILLDNFNSTMLKAKLPNLHEIGILEEDVNCTEVKQIAETLKHDRLVLTDHRGDLYLRHLDRPSIC